MAGIKVTEARNKQDIVITISVSLLLIQDQRYICVHHLAFHSTRFLHSISFPSPHLLEANPPHIKLSNIYSCIVNPHAPGMFHQEKKINKAKSTRPCR